MAFRPLDNLSLAGSCFVAGSWVALVHKPLPFAVELADSLSIWQVKHILALLMNSPRL